MSLICHPNSGQVFKWYGQMKSEKNKSPIQWGSEIWILNGRYRYVKLLDKLLLNLEYSSPKWPKSYGEVTGADQPCINLLIMIIT